MVVGKAENIPGYHARIFRRIFPKTYFEHHLKNQLAEKKIIEILEQNKGILVKDPNSLKKDEVGFAKGAFYKITEAVDLARSTTKLGGVIRGSSAFAASIGLVAGFFTLDNTRHSELQQIAKKLLTYSGSLYLPALRFGGKKFKKLDKRLVRLEKPEIRKLYLESAIAKLRLSSAIRQEILDTHLAIQKVKIGRKEQAEMAKYGKIDSELNKKLENI